MISAAFRPSKAILELGPEFYDVVAAASFPEHRLRFQNRQAAAEIGLADCPAAEWTDHFARFRPFAGSLDQHLALRYHGHQFRIYNPDLGDGRGFLLAQVLDGAGRLLDLGSKGSGQTPWSRGADGRLTLKGGVREVLAAEMLQALGVTTARTLSLTETGERLWRGDEPSPTRSSVLVRLAHSHIRYGTFQRLAFLEKPAEMHSLVRYVLQHVAQQDAGKDAVQTLMHYAVGGAARLAAEWHVAGFVHGVLNTDNSNISGESFDYGPWRFLPRFDPGFTAAYFDEGGLYAFGRQAEALQWNLVQLARALRLIAAPEQLLPALKRYPELLEQYVHRQAMWRLGLCRRTPAEEAALLQALEQDMAASGLPPDLVWFSLRGGRRDRPLPAGFAATLRLLPSFEPLPGALAHPYWQDSEPQMLHLEAVERIWAAIADDDDWAPFEGLIRSIRRMGEAMRAAGPPSQKRV